MPGTAAGQARAPGLAQLVIAIGAATASVLASASASGVAPCEEAKLVAPDGDAYDWLGESVAADPTVAVVSARGDDDNGDGAGAAYVLRHDGLGWAQTAKLLAADGAAGDGFGSRVDIDGDLVVVGAWGDDDGGEDAGAGYVFRFDGVDWIEEAKLVASTAAAGDRLGRSAAVDGDGDGDTIVIGGPQRVFVFGFDGVAWSETQELEPTGGVMERFGNAVAVNGAVIAVAGEYTQRDEVVHLFRFDGAAWSVEDLARPLPLGFPDAFGAALALVDGTLVVGAPNDRDQGFESGAVYVFRNEGTGWPLEQKIVSWDASSAATFGGSVSLADDTLVIGAARDDASERSAGAVYVYRHDGVSWAGVTKLLAGDGAEFARFGSAVALGDTTVLAGAPGANAVADSSGAVYVLADTLVGPDCDGDRISDPCAVVTGVADDCNENGVPDPCDLAEGTSDDCDANGVPDECDVDCNENGRPDPCDVAEGTSEDANGNGVPDECEGFGYCEATRFVATWGTERDWFGVSVASDGDVVIVGEPFDYVRPPSSGTAYVYRFDGDAWIEETTLFLPDGGSGNDVFGTAVAVEGNVAVVSALFAGPQRGGRADVFRFDGDAWHHEATLVPADPEYDAYFGRVLDIHSDRVIVGARRHDLRQGAAYVYRHDGGQWFQEAKLTAADAERGDKFGAGVALGADFAAVGAVWDDNENGEAAGAVYIFRIVGDTWVEETKLLPSDGAPGAAFGGSVAIDDQRLLVGGFGVREAYVARAHVYRFDGKTWREEASLTGSTATGAHDVVPGQVAIDGDLAIIGFASDGTLGERAGAAFAYELVGATWVERHTIFAAGGEALDDFGNALALTGSTAFIGAPVRSAFGAVRVIDLRQEDCNHNGFCDGNDIAEGRSRDVNGNGVPDECEGLGDVNGDGRVDGDDLGRVLAAWGPCEVCPEDLDGSGVVDVADILIVLWSWS